MDIKRLGTAELISNIAKLHCKTLITRLGLELKTRVRVKTFL